MRSIAKRMSWKWEASAEWECAESCLRPAKRGSAEQSASFMEMCSVIAVQLHMDVHDCVHLAWHVCIVSEVNCSVYSKLLEHGILSEAGSHAALLICTPPNLLSRLAAPAVYSEQLVALDLLGQANRLHLSGRLASAV